MKSRSIGGATALLVAYLAAAGLLLWATVGAFAAIKAPGAPGSAPVGALLAAAAALGAWAVLTWLTCVTLAAVLTAAFAGVGSRAHDRALALAPAAARRLAGAVLGLSVVSGPLAAAVPAGAVQTAHGPAAVAAVNDIAPRARAGGDLSRDHDRRRPTSTAAASPSLDRPAPGVPDGWTPDRPARAKHGVPDSTVRLVTAAHRRGGDPVEEVVVRRGDTLWDIAARHLAAPATSVDIAREWPRWYAANRAVIGTDPDLLLPGQRLVAPIS